MRNLTSIESANDVLLDIEFHVKASDASTTWIFDRNSIQRYPSPEWEIDFTGGLGKVSNYDITLASSIGFLTENFQNLNRAQAFLKVFVNSDNFTPHVGRVRGIDREANNPNIFQFTVYEDFLDGDPKIPVDSIQDSYETVHPEILNVDFGYPLYYGKHIRPFYFTPVDCEIKTLLGPRNVSSENHLGDAFYFIEPIEDVRLNYVGDWSQQSGSTNIMSTDLAFETFEITTDRPRAIDTGDLISGRNSQISLNRGLHGFLDTEANSFTAAVFWNHNFKKVVPMRKSTKIFIYSDVSTGIIVNGSSLIPHTLDLKRGASTIGGLIVVNSNTMSSSADMSSLDILLSGDFEFGIQIRAGDQSVPLLSPKNATMQFSYSLYYQLESSAYKNYSVYNSQVNCSEIAISENPNRILADIIDQTSFDYVTSQNSNAQSQTESYNLQCFFGERIPLSDILQEFGEISATHYWIGDSGFINMRTYQESSIVADSIDFTLTTCDIIEDSLVIKDNPIGFIYYQTEKASRIKVDYEFDFAQNQYLQSMIVDKNNNAFCDSAFNAGIQNEKTIRTKYIMESQTTSYYIDNLVRRLATDDNIIEGSLPARFMGMELCDVLRIQHPSLLNSESLYQVTKIKPDYETGQVNFTANEIINIT